MSLPWAYGAIEVLIIIIIIIIIIVTNCYKILDNLLWTG